LENRRAEQILPVGVSISGKGKEAGEGGRERVWEDEYSTNTVCSIFVDICVHIYVNGKMIPVETVPGMGVVVKENVGGGKFKYDIFDVL
jgi:hypothetical protein